MEREEGTQQDSDATTASTGTSDAPTPLGHALSERDIGRSLMRAYESETEDENKERGNWGNDLQFILACMGFSIGLGNVWRFPFLMYKYGGGFLLVYWLMLVLVAFPVFTYELSLGQFASTGPLHVFRNLVPALEGIGWSTIYLNVGYSVYYNAIHAYAIFYLFSAFGSPWKRCEDPALIANTYNTRFCYTVDDDKFCVRDEPHLRYYAKKACYNNDNVGPLFVGKLEECLAHAGLTYADPSDSNTWECGVKFRFIFNATAPLTIFKLPSTALSAVRKADFDLCESVGFPKEVLFDYRDPCEIAEVSWRTKPSSWLRPSKDPRNEQSPLILTINLAHQAPDTTADVEERAKCFYKLLQLSQWTNSSSSAPSSVRATSNCTVTPAQLPIPRLWYVLRHYCDATFGREMSNVSCVRRVVDPVESFSSAEYYRHYAIRGSLSDFDQAGFSYPLLLSLLVAWLLVFVGVYKGPKWIGKIVYVTAIFPIIMIIILIIVSVTLDGHQDGVKYYMFFDFCRLKNPQLWLDALVQVYYSLGIGTGGLMTLASYNRFHNDIARDSLIVALSNCIFSFIGGFGIFGVIGFMAKQVGTDVPNVLRGEGSGMAFVVFAQATAILPGGETLAFFFYLMLLLLAIDSEFAGVETVLTFFYDEFPALKKHRAAATGIVCSFGCLLGIPFVSNIGMHAVDILDAALYVHALPVLSFLSIVGTMWIYGARRLMKDVQMMVGVPSKVAPTPEAPMLPGGEVKTPRVLHFFFATPARYYFLFTWLILAPLVVGAMAGVNYYTVFKDWSRASLGETWKFVLGSIPVYACVAGALVWNLAGRGLSFGDLFRPRPAWGPALPQHRRDSMYAQNLPPPKH